MASRRVKKQSNFFHLSLAICEYQFPFTAQIIPSLEFPDFQSNEKHKMTFLSEHCQQKLKLIQNDGEVTSMNMTDNDVYYLNIHNDINFEIIADVIKLKRREDFEWLAVMQKVCYKSHVLEVGHILHIESESKFNSLMRKNKRTLKVKVYPSGTLLSLPQDLKIMLKKCENYNNKKTICISELAFQGNLPCIIFFPEDNEHEYNTTDGMSVKGKYMLLEEQYTSRVLLACKLNRNKEIEVHSFPSTTNLEIEILHGEMPVTSFSPEEIRVLTHELVLRNPCKAEQIHQKRFLRDINLKMFEYENSSDDDDEDSYINAQEIETISHKASEQTHNEESEDDEEGYMDMRENTIKRMLTNTMNALPLYIKKNSNKLEKNFKFTPDPSSKSNSMKVNNPAPPAAAYKTPGYKELSQNENLSEEKRIEDQKIGNPGARHSYITLCDDYEMNDEEHVYESTCEISAAKNAKVETFYSSLDDQAFELPGYYELNMKYEKGDAENECDFSGYEVNYFTSPGESSILTEETPPDLPEKKSRRPIPAKRKDIHQDTE